MSDLTIATEIKSQLGHQFCVMTGAKNFAGDKDSLMFNIPGSKVCNKIKITLNASDYYDVYFYKIRGANFKTVKISADVFAGDLRRHIGEVTGLATSLGA